MTRKERKEMREAISIIRNGECALVPYSYYWPAFYDKPGIFQFTDCLSIAIEETDAGEYYRQNRDLLALSILCSELGDVPNE